MEEIRSVKVPCESVVKVWEAEGETLQVLEGQRPLLCVGHSHSHCVCWNAVRSL